MSLSSLHSSPPAFPPVRPLLRRPAVNSSPIFVEGDCGYEGRGMEGTNEKGEWMRMSGYGGQEGKGGGWGGICTRRRLLVSGNEEEMTPLPPPPVCALFASLTCVRAR